MGNCQGKSPCRKNFCGLSPVAGLSSCCFLRLQAAAFAEPGHLLALGRCLLGWGIRQRELKVDGARTLAEPPEKPGGNGALGMASCTSHRVQLVTHSLTHSLTH